MTLTDVVTHPGTDRESAPSCFRTFVETAHAHATEPAIAGEDGTLTYAALLDSVEALGSRLQEAGVGTDDVVAVVLDRSADTIVAMLAVLASGGVYCPLDPAEPPARTAAAVRRLGIRVAVADQPAAAGLGEDVLVIDPGRLGSSAVGAAFAAAQPDADALAYVLHTSGSTGVPKAVAMTHAGLDRLIAWQIADGPPGLRTLQFTATSFDVTFQEVLSTLATGGCLVLASEQLRRDPDALLDALVEHRVQRLFLPYVALQLLATAAARRGLAVLSLEHVVTAGERLVITPAIRAFFAAVPRCRLDNHYGPTETHLVTRYTLHGAAQSWPDAPSIGTPVTGVECRVLDEDLTPVSDGEVGELYVGGRGVARGYLRDGRRTGERFVAGPSGRLYRTGDLVRRTPDGLEFVGRDDDQLKVRGFRVEPAEVESTLLQHPRVDAAAVGLRELAEGVPVLVGYVQASGEATHRDLADHLRDRLPSQLVPTRFVQVDSLPRTVTGKIDRTALTELPLPQDAGEDPGDRLGLAGTITAIWRRVLGHDEFDDDDDFFDIGGDSLLATWVVAELEQEFGIELGLSVFLDDSTVRGLATGLETDGMRVGHRTRSSKLVTLRPGPSARSLYLVHPLGGELLGYRELVRASRAPFRLVGISWTGEPPATGSTLEDIAQTHVEQLLSVQPEGPYLLAGWSFGGVLANEMAQQLGASGAAVDLLGMIDANPVVDPLSGLALSQAPFREMLDELLARLAGPTSSGEDVEQLTSGPVWKQLMGAPITTGVSTSHLRGALATARACMDAAMRYRPRPYGGPVTLFLPTEADPDHRARSAAALRSLLTGAVTAIDVPGDHWGLLRAPHVELTAAALDAAIETAGAEGVGAGHGS